MTRPLKIFDHTKREELRQAYNTALELKSETFVFEGAELYTLYAKYLLEWLDMELGPRR